MDPSLSYQVNTITICVIEVASFVLTNLAVTDKKALEVQAYHALSYYYENIHHYVID